jgi:hypothetical protein
MQYMTAQVMPACMLSGLCPLHHTAAPGHCATCCLCAAELRGHGPGVQSQLHDLSPRVFGSRRHMQRGGQSWQRRKPLAPLCCAMYSWPAPVCAQTKGGGGVLSCSNTGTVVISGLTELPVVYSCPRYESSLTASHVAAGQMAPTRF